MSPTRVARLLLRSVTVLVAVSSATYVLVYLYRWEWHRALMSGVIFVAAELGLVGGLLLGRLAKLERRLATPPAADGSRETGAALAVETAVPGPGARPFAWMDPNRLGVFIPVLMGAGAILSGLAYLVERVAKFVAAEPVAPGPRRGAAGLAGGVALPVGGFLASAAPCAEPRRQRGRFLLVTVALLAAAFAVTALVDVVADLTESRPDPVNPELATEIVLSLGYHNYDRRSALGAASALVEACRTTVPERTRFAPVELVEGRRVLLAIQPALGRHEIRRFRGCIGDATLDRVHATIEEIRTVPAESGA